MWLGEHDHESNALMVVVSSICINSHFNINILDYDFAHNPGVWTTPSDICPCQGALNEAMFNNRDPSIFACKRYFFYFPQAVFPNKRHGLDVKVLSNDQCKNWYENSTTGKMLCTLPSEAGKGPWAGDQGGPLVTSGLGAGLPPGRT